ncbi:hypothetical protein DW114_17855 [Absiella sp. AM09-50]|nr:hypothetical protein DW271_17470 [Absiella sp. AM22-9]RGB54888.1 hypothetical protein DW120_18345 [Absiella sp. AM10-20]RGB63912.1 hypothetical protein DW113_16740 [Absiella sp. AM09-45]RGB72439.1 hypothetical protein DW114_17855 [Absiella sp. AM09-50]RHU00642.1 hypothetical protein DW716_18975 [Absiella sp. AM27-20]
MHCNSFAYVVITFIISIIIDFINLIQLLAKKGKIFLNLILIMIFF